MLDDAQPRILILAEPALTDRWRQLLVDRLRATVHCDWRQFAADEQVDVVLREATGPAASKHANGDEGTARAAVISVGDCAESDVNLPSDASDREVVLACRLMTALSRASRQGERPVAERAALALDGIDSLTKLPNRGAWDRQLALLHQRSRQNWEPLCVAIFDLDYFKQINDGFGYAAGDDTLVAFARALDQSSRHGDFIARLGGDEFGLLLPGLDAAAAGAVLERIRAGLPAKTAAHVPHVAGASAGYSVFVPPEATRPEELFREATEALQQAKRQGRGRTANNARYS